MKFENFSKKGCSLNLEREKPNLTTFGPPLAKFWRNPSVPPPGKNSSDAHGCPCLFNEVHLVRSA